MEIKNGSNGIILHDGDYRSQIDTPYGKAELNFFNGTAIQVYLYDSVPTSGRIVRVRYELTNGEWKRETSHGTRSVDWRRDIPKKDRTKILIVLEALLLKWIADNAVQVAMLKVYKSRYRAWNTANSANHYADTANKVRAEADEAERKIYFPEVTA